VRVDRFAEARRDRFHHAAVTRHGFSRSETPSFDKRCAALPPASRPAIAHPFPGSRPPDAFGVTEPELPPGRFSLVLRTTEGGWSALGRLRLLSPRLASQRKVSYAERAPTRGGRDDARFSSEGLAPVHRISPMLFRAFALGRGASLGGAACRHLQRDNNVRARSTRSPPRPPRNHVPLARPMIPWRLPFALLPFGFKFP
jgi:hypothetical protein